MSNMPEHIKIRAMNDLLVVGVSKEDSRSLMDEEDFGLFEQMYDEFDLAMVRQAAGRTTSINFWIDTKRDLFKMHIRHDTFPLIHK